MKSKHLYRKHFEDLSSHIPMNFDLQEKIQTRLFSRHKIRVIRTILPISATATFAIMMGFVIMDPAKAEEKFNQIKDSIHVGMNSNFDSKAHTMSDQELEELKKNESIQELEYERNSDSESFYIAGKCDDEDCSNIKNLTESPKYVPNNKTPKLDPYSPYVTIGEHEGKMLFSSSKLIKNKEGENIYTEFSSSFEGELPEDTPVTLDPDNTECKAYMTDPSGKIRCLGKENNTE